MPELIPSFLKPMFERRAAARSVSLRPVQGSKAKRFTLALMAMAVALALRSLFQPILGESMQYVSISAATVFAAWYCGLGPAIVSTIIGVAAANVLFVSPYLPLGRYTEREIVGKLLFLVFAGAIIAMGEAGRRSWIRLGHVHEVLLQSRTQLKFRVRQRTAQLQQINQDLRDLSVRLLRVQDDERRRIARDLHDSTGQALTALKLEMAGIERELATRDAANARRLASAIETARQISDELRTISYLLHPPLLDELGLSSALRWYIDGFEKRSGIKVHFDLNTSARLSAELETMFFRMIQECLVNVHRHSGSATAVIRLSQTGGMMIVEVEDQGRGIEADELADITAGATPGVGLRGMRERINDFGGKLQIESSEKGTKIRATIPVEAAGLDRVFLDEAASNVASVANVGSKRASTD
jgi:signal transduction histidine kinase